MGHCKSSAKGKFHSNSGLPQEIRKITFDNAFLLVKGSPYFVERTISTPPENFLTAKT